MCYFVSHELKSEPRVVQIFKTNQKIINVSILYKYVLNPWTAVRLHHSKDGKRKMLKNVRKAEKVIQNVQVLLMGYINFIR